MYLEDVVSPLPVEVQSCHVRPRHPVDHPVRIHHRDNHKIKMGLKLPTDLIRIGKQLYDLFGDEGANSLAGVLSRQDNHYFGIDVASWTDLYHWDDIVGD